MHVAYFQRRYASLFTLLLFCFIHITDYNNVNVAQAACDAADGSWIITRLQAGQTAAHMAFNIVSKPEHRQTSPTK